MYIFITGGAVAEWSKALQLREKINENQKIPGSPPGLGKKKDVHFHFHLKPSLVSLIWGLKWPLSILMEAWVSFRTRKLPFKPCLCVKIEVTIINLIKSNLKNFNYPSSLVMDLQHYLHQIMLPSSLNQLKGINGAVK